MEKEYVRINWKNRPSIDTPLGQINLNKMDYQIDKNENTLITFDTTKANQSDLLQTIRTLTYDTETGIFVFTFWNGSTYSVDLNIEKIPVTFSMDEYGVITMTTADGTTYTCDIGALIKLYTFVDGDEIDFVTTTDAGGNKTITASIKDGSIVGSKLQPNFLADCQAAKAQAELAATSASSDASDAELSSEDSEAWAVGERNGVPVPSTDPAYENNAKWWAQHGTGSSFAGLSDTNFTNLQNGQIAKYNSTTQKWENANDEGGLLPHFYIDSEAGSTVTVTTPSGGTITPTLMSSGHWECDVPTYGTYIVHAVLNGEDATKTVAVNEVREYHITDTHFSYTLNVYAPQDSMIRIEATGETYTDTGEGSTAVVFSLGQKETQYTITVTYDGLTRTDSVTTPSTSGGSGSKTIEFGTINLTLDEDLIGETIVMTNGTATKSKVADSTSMAFYPNATGNWTISCQYDGETYYSEPNPVAVSSLSTPVSAEISLVHIPEGATVLPTDDIQTWLACANITDKSYTTLAEILADRETFETLIADSNACDYMARSTSWAGVTGGLVPVMTGYTTPSGRVWFDSSYTEWSPSKIWWLFNGTETGGDNSASGLTQTDSWFAYEFPTPTIVNKFYMMNETQTVVYAGNFTIDASNDGNTWTTLGTFTNSGQGQAGSKTYYDINNETPYLHYRYHNLTQGTGAAESHGWSAQEMQFYHEAICQNQDSMSLIGKYDYCSNALLGNTTWLNAIANSDYWDRVLQPLVPKLTTDSSSVITNLQVKATGYEKWHAFDGNTGGQFFYFQYTPSRSDGWVGYDFGTPVRVCKASMYNVSNTASIKNCKYQYSDDGTTWVDATELITNAMTGTWTDAQISNNSGAHRYWCAGNLINNGDGSGAYIPELQFYGRASSEVLVPLVPTMTSNTTPSGVCSADTEYSTYLAWKAFDGSTASSDGWIANSGSFPHWIKYEFPSAIKVNAAGFRNINGNHAYAIKNYKIQGSNDNESWIDLYTGINNNNSNNDLWTVNFDNSTAYKYYRVYIIDGWSSNPNYRCDIGYIQFYAKTVQTNIIHSTPNDTIYMLEDGDPIVLATTNSDGDGILDFSQLSAGPVTLYSSVAKNPEDLTADYSKAITITKTQYGGTTEAYLMPDTIKTLYWWGYESSELEDMSTANGWTASGITYITPTRNTNDIYLNTSTTNQLTGIGTKNAITASTIKSIITGISNYSNMYGQMCRVTTKTNNASDAVNIDTNTAKLYTYQGSNNIYAFIAGWKAPQGTASSKVHAFWYE